MIRSKGYCCRQAAVLAALLLFFAAGCGSAEGKGPANVIIVLLDTVRSDHLSCYGYPEKTSPHIDALAADGVLFRRLMPQASWTRPSVASLLTSTYPPTHGAEDRHDPVRPDLPWLSSALLAQGYETVGVVTNPHCLPVWGFGEGFNQYLSYCSAEGGKDGNDITAVDAALSTIDCVEGKPWFVYLHLMAAHRPYTAPEGYAARFRPDKYTGTRPQRWVQADLVKYDGEIAWVDEQVGRLVAELKRQGQYDNTLIMLVSDHGEQFGEHGAQGHGVSLHEEELRVPLILKLPGGRLDGETRQALVEMVDIAPTVLDLLGLQPESRFEGRSFAGIVEQDRWEYRAGFASLKLDGVDQRAVESRLAKCIEDEAAGGTFWFNSEQDSGERHPLFRPPKGAECFSDVSTLVRSLGINGVHVLVWGETGAVRITVDGAEAEGFLLDCPGGAGEARAVEGGVEARVDLGKLAGAGEDLKLARSGWTPHAHLVVEPGAAGKLGVRVERDGEVVGPENVSIGPRGDEAVLDGSDLDVAPMACEPLEGPAAMQTGAFGVRVWSVVPAKKIEPATIPKETADALEALGYLK